MRVLPLCYCEQLTAEDVLQHEASDRVWVPKPMFERWMDAEDVGSVVIFRMDNQAACMWAYHASDTNTIYAPTWMCQALGVPMDPFEDVVDYEGSDVDDDYDPCDQGITPIRYTPAMCTSVVLQPHTSAHLCVPDETPDEALSRGFENYTCLTEGQTMSLRLTNGETVTVTVTEAHPRPTKGAPKPLCIRNPSGALDVVLDLLPPLDALVEEPQTSPNGDRLATSNCIISPEVLERLKASMDAPVPEVPTPAPQPDVETPPQVVPLDREARRTLMARAALARIGKEVM